MPAPKSMKFTDGQKDFLASLGVGVLSMVLFVMLMGSVVLWGQNAGQKVRSELSNRQAPVTTEPSSDDGPSSQ